MSRIKSSIVYGSKEENAIALDRRYRCLPSEKETAITGSSPSKNSPNGVRSFKCVIIAVLGCSTKLLLFHLEWSSNANIFSKNLCVRRERFFIGERFVWVRLVLIFPVSPYLPLISHWTPWNRSCYCLRSAHNSQKDYSGLFYFPNTQTSRSDIWSTLGRRARFESGKRKVKQKGISFQAIDS